MSDDFVHLPVPVSTIVAGGCYGPTTFPPGVGNDPTPGTGGLLAILLGAVALLLVWLLLGAVALLLGGWH